MADITSETTLEELAAIISQGLESQGILATLSGGAAVSIYTNNRYQSFDVDFVSSEGSEQLEKAVSALGFMRTDAQRLFSHPQSPWLLEFPAGPLGFGQKVVDAADLEAINTPYGPLRVITPTLCVMDRLAAYLHWQDRQCYDQAIWVCQNHSIHWEDLKSWAFVEGMDEELWQIFYDKASDR